MTEQNANTSNTLPKGVKSAENEWWDLLKTAFWAILFAVLIRSFLYEPFNIPSGSMKPSLLVGDYLFVNKMAYGYSQYSLPLGLPLIEGRIFATPPEQGDIIVFKLPSNPSVDYIKRLIGLPGDRIQMIKGRLHINGKQIAREALPQEALPRLGLQGQVTNAYFETLPNGVEHIILEDTDEGPLDNTPEFTVPPGHYFFMGDNRDNSQDSRVQQLVGFVPFENLVGKADRIFFSIQEGVPAFQFWRWPMEIRYTRLLKSLAPERPTRVEP